MHEHQTRDTQQLIMKSWQGRAFLKVHLLGGATAGSYALHVCITRMYNKNALHVCMHVEQQQVRRHYTCALHDCITRMHYTYTLHVCMHVEQQQVRRHYTQALQERIKHVPVTQLILESSCICIARARGQMSFAAAACSSSILQQAQTQSVLQPRSRIKFSAQLLCSTLQPQSQVKTSSPAYVCMLWLRPFNEHVMWTNLPQEPQHKPEANLKITEVSVH